MSLIGVVSPAAVTIAQPEKSDPALVKTLVPGVIAGVVGASLWEKHRVLGFLTGDAIGLNAYRLYRGKGDDRTRAATNLVASGAGIAGALFYKERPFVGWCAGFLVGAVATSFVEGSASNRLKNTLRGK